MTSRLLPEVRRRLLPHAIFFLAVWPFFSALSAALALKEHTLTRATPWKAIAAGLSAAVLRTAPEFAAVAALLLLLGVLLFASLEASLPPRAGVSPRLQRAVEPPLFLLALLSGAALEYPVLLRHPLLAFLRPLSVWHVTLLLPAACLALALLLFVRRNALAPFALTACLVLAGWGMTLLPPTGSRRAAAPGTTVLLGIDSLSQEEDVSALQNLTRNLGGTWYQRPVTPGLLTNSVWPSILMHRPVHQTGTLLVYQEVNWSASPFHLVRLASERGCRTVSFFSDQFTTSVGSDGGFQRNRSGPKGWLQLATASLKDGSVFLPILLPRLPPIPGARTPANQSGTFAFDIHRELREILTAGSESAGRCSFVAGHVDYLHQALYPRYSELTPAERSAVRDAAVESLQDMSLDWQFPIAAGEPIPLYRWKLRRVQTLVVQVLEETGFLRPGLNNRLVLFSDHGNRRAVTPKNFGEARYHRVVLATFGVPGRDPERPISLLDAAELLGFPDPTRPGPADPVVEYTNATASEWNELMRTARLRSDGAVFLDPEIVEQIGKRLTGFRPYSGENYFPVPLAPSRTPASTER